MNNFRLIISACAIAIFTLVSASVVQAQATRTWVSGVGDDANPCSRTAPCKTFAGAISKTATGGEISALDPGGFGTLTINKSITINGEGTLASNLSAGISGFTINATDTSVINIRYVSVNGNNTVGAFHGVRILQAATVNLEDVAIYNFGGDGVNVAESSNVNVSLNRVTVSNCTGAGIRADTSAGIARVTVRNSSFTNCGTGLYARRNSRVAMTNSTVSFNTIGVLVEGTGGIAVAVLESCQIANNFGNGVQAGSAAATNLSVARISNNIINNNAGSGVSIQGNGGVDTFLDNRIIGNNPDGCVGCNNVSAINLN